MDIYKFIPDLSSNWCINHQTLYFKKSGLIPILREIDGVIFISLDRRVLKAVIKLTKKMESLNHPFFYCDRLSINGKHIYKEDLQKIITNYLQAISDEVFFKFIKNSDFDFVMNLTRFIETFECSRTFKVNYDDLKVNYYNKLWIDWYTRKEHWQVRNEEIRDYYNILERQIKLNIFFS